MKHITYLLIIACFFISCGKSKMSQLEHEKDSLLNVTANQQSVLQSMTSTVAEISTALDSISLQEQMLLQKNDEKGNPMTKDVLKVKLDNLANTLKMQREKLASMEASLKGDKKEMAQLKEIVSFLNEALAKKNEEILALRADLEKKNIDISKLHTRVKSLTHEVKGAQKQISSQNEEINKQAEQLSQNEKTIAKQDESLNEVYYIIGTKDQLKKSGIITKTGNFIQKALKKSQVNFANIDKSLLKKADIRHLRTIDIPSKSAKIIGNVPKDSYNLTSKSGSTTLTINDANKFWSSNNRILVIQIK